MVNRRPLYGASYLILLINQCPPVKEYRKYQGILSAGFIVVQRFPGIHSSVRNEYIYCYKSPLSRSVLLWGLCKLSCACSKLE